MKWWQILARANAAKKDQAQLLIYGAIGESFWTESVSAKECVKAIDEVTEKELRVRIKSPGGSVADGIAIHNALRALSAKGVKVITCNEGEAASIASLILMAGDEVQSYANATTMVHAPWAYVAGNAEEMREYADVLDKMAASMATSYARKTGKGKDHAMGLLDGKDHHFTAAEAKAEGLIDTVIDEIAEPEAEAIAASRGFTKTLFAELFPDLQREALATLRQPAKPAAATSPQNPQEQFMNLRAFALSLGLTVAAGATDDAIRAQITQHLGISASATEPEIVEAYRLKAVAAAGDANKARIAGITEMFALAPNRVEMAELEMECLRDGNISALEAGKKILAFNAAGAKPGAGNRTADDDPTKASAGETADEKRAKALENSIMARAGLGKHDPQNEFNGQTLYQMAYDAAGKVKARQGRAVNKLDVVASAFTHSTSDFTSVLANVAHKSMLKGYDEAEESFPQFTSKNSLSDYKLTKRVDLNSIASLPSVGEGGEYGYATVGDHGENVLLGKFGRLFSITREAIINDDLQAFTKIPQKMGRAAKRTIGDIVFAILTGNPVMTEDNVTLFNAAHANLLGAGTPITSTNVDLMRQAMVLQKDRTATATALGIRLKHLIVPVALGAQARIVRDSQFQVDVITAAKGSQNTIPNPVKGIFDVIEDYRLDAFSLLTWFGAADQNVNDTIEVSYLDGNEQPWLDSKEGWSVDGIEWKVRIEAVAKALDYKGLYRNPGA